MEHRHQCTVDGIMCHKCVCTQPAAFLYFYFATSVVDWTLKRYSENPAHVNDLEWSQAKDFCGLEY